MKGVSARYREYGHLIDTRASKEVKVIVSGDSFVNLRCSLLLDDTHSIASHRYVAVATQLENEARAVVARKLKVRTSGSCGKLSPIHFWGFPPQGRTMSPSASALDVTGVIVWGNISGRFYVDLQRAKVFNYNGAIRGPAFFSQPVQKMIHERFGILCRSASDSWSNCLIYFTTCLTGVRHPSCSRGRLNKQNVTRCGPHLPANYKTTVQSDTAAAPIINTLYARKEPVTSFSLLGNGWKQTFKTWYAVSVQLWLQRRATRPPCRPPMGSSLS